MNNNAEMEEEALKQKLRFQGGPGSLENNINRKRPSDESDDGAPTKRLTKLQEKNKMLASLLAGPSRPIVTINTSSLPAIRQIPDIPPYIKNSLASPLENASTPNQNIPNNKTSMNNNNNSATKNNNLKTSQHQKFNRQQQQQQQLQQSVNRGQHMSVSSNSVKQVNESIYLPQLQAHQQQQQQQQQIALGRTNVFTTTVNSQSSMDGSDSQYVSSSPATILAAASSSTIQPQTTDSALDPELSDLLDLFDDTGYNEDPMNFVNNMNNLNTNAQLKQQEELAQINKIQQSLMECEDEANFTGSPPAYSMHTMNQQNRLQQAGYSQPPPGYNQRNVRLPQLSVSSNNIVTNSNAAGVVQSTVISQRSNAMLLERLRLHQQSQLILEQKQRLLQQQQNQQIVVTAGAEQLCKFTFAI
jgi:hypothetical protein